MNEYRSNIPVDANPQTKYRVHRFNLSMTANQGELERYLNSLTGEIIAIIPNVTMGFFWIHRVDFLLVVEKVG